MGKKANTRGRGGPRQERAAPTLAGAGAAAAQLWPVARLRAHERASVVPDMRPDEYAQLLADIAARGVRQALEATEAGVVLDGRHRLRAALELRLPELPVRVVAPEDELEHMLRAALLRRQLSTSQRAALVVELQEYEQQRAQALERSRANLRQNANSAEVATLPPRGERTRETAARAAGVSPRSVQHALTVRAHDPQLFQAVKDGKHTVSSAARRVLRAQRDAAIPPPPPLPDGPFQVIYGDPPWQLGNPDGPFAPENHYPTLPVPDIIAVAPPAAEDALLFLWAVNSHLPQALEVMEAWGFEYVGQIVWVKPWIGLGNWTRNRHELLLIGRRGQISPPHPEDRPDSVLEAPRGRHSQKPEAAYELIEIAYPTLTKLELFARNARPGWTAWGNQAPA